ncbi:MAG: GGDEF domain-containing protein [Variibacter sp.]|nr:GGDEF domain-containing protein [Variibacter sp.]
MRAGSDEHDRTMVFAEIALGQIKALRQPADPLNYEIWYHYATGYNPLLNKTINEALERKGNLDAADLDAIRDQYIASSRLNQQIDTLGAKVADEIDHIMGMVGTAMGSASSYGATLANATRQIGRAKDGEGLRAIIEGLIRTTKEIERTNQLLEERLKASRQEIKELQERLDAVRQESLTDPLTSLANRKYFDQALAKALAEAEERNVPLSLALIDIDHFKTFNDTFGHLTGDQVLRLVGQCIKQNVKGQDTPARYGGEEFAVILPRTAVPQAVTVADHVRRAVMGKELIKRSTGESLGRITVSVGVAGWRRDDTAGSLIERADACLYAAKRGGRNRVVCDTDPGVAPARTKVA